jgi:hypothetical protein
MNYKIAEFNNSASDSVILCPKIRLLKPTLEEIAVRLKIQLLLYIFAIHSGFYLPRGTKEVI